MPTSRGRATTRRARRPRPPRPPRATAEVEAEVARPEGARASPSLPFRGGAGAPARRAEIFCPTSARYPRRANPRPTTRRPETPRRARDPPVFATCRFWRCVGAEQATAVPPQARASAPVARRLDDARAGRCTSRELVRLRGWSTPDGVTKRLSSGRLATCTSPAERARHAGARCRWRTAAAGPDGERCGRRRRRRRAGPAVGLGRVRRAQRGVRPVEDRRDDPRPRPTRS